MRVINELQQAEMRSMFRRMYHDIGYDESLKVLQEILLTAELLCEILAEEIKNNESNS